MILYNQIQKLQAGNKFIDKRGVELQLKEYANSKKDKKELQSTGQIKSPRSIFYKRNVKSQPIVSKDIISNKQREAQLGALERPLIYLASPDKILGDLGVPGMETSELDRQSVVSNRLNPYQSRLDRLKNKAKLGVGYVPKAALNVGMAAAFMPEGSGALGLVNETINPLVGLKNILKQRESAYLYRVQPRDFNIDISPLENMKKAVANGDAKWFVKSQLNNPDRLAELSSRDAHYGQWFEKDPKRLQYYLDDKIDSPVDILKLKVRKKDLGRYNVGESGSQDAKKWSLSHDTEFIVPKELIPTAKKYKREDWEAIIKKHKY